ncbi:HalOD1 output domain-containing protein [Haloarcula rara]|uniref:HalOD1 output domain-containing protein n=1 Tax=Haloarcula rara TaxID=3033387 RepID=UPI0023E77532|nr:HalOD1 output domain-containing protein [Halomicroarcula sp. SHR3]
MSGLDPWHALGGSPGLEGAERVTDDGPTYDPKTDTYVGIFETESASVAVMEALASVRHCEPTELDPLYCSVDPDALDRLVASGSDQLCVTMHIDGFEVVVTGSRRIEITPPE